MIEAFFELLAEFIFELILRILGEAIIVTGLYSMASVFKEYKQRNPYMAFIGYALWGLIIGGISIWILPKHIVKPSKYYGINLILTPIVAGFIMATYGNYKSRLGKIVFKIDSFCYGWVFAFGMSIIRFKYI